MIKNNYLLKTENNKYKELVAIPKCDLKNVKELYQKVFNEYAGKLNTVKLELKHLRDSNRDLKESNRDKDEIIKLLKEKIAQA